MGIVVKLCTKSYLNMPWQIFQRPEHAVLICAVSRIACTRVHLHASLLPNALSLRPD